MNPWSFTSSISSKEPNQEAKQKKIDHFKEPLVHLLDAITGAANFLPPHQIRRLSLFRPTARLARRSPLSRRPRPTNYISKGALLFRKRPSKAAENAKRDKKSLFIHIRGGGVCFSGQKRRLQRAKHD
jgi:hypothetical protein